MVSETSVKPDWKKQDRQPERVLSRCVRLYSDEADAGFVLLSSRSGA